MHGHPQGWINTMKKTQARSKRTQSSSPLKRKFLGDPLIVPRDLDGAYRLKNRLDGLTSREFGQDCNPIVDLTKEENS